MVLDCVNMAPSAGKVTPKDAQFAEALESRFPALPPRGALFQNLNDAKFDVSGWSQCKVQYVKVFVNLQYFCNVTHNK